MTCLEGLIASVFFFKKTMKPCIEWAKSIKLISHISKIKEKHIDIEFVCVHILFFFHFDKLV